MTLIKNEASLKIARARLQYEVAQQPRLLEYLPTPLIELLHTTLDSHRLALTIDQENADLLLYAVACKWKLIGLTLVVIQPRY